VKNFTLATLMAALTLTLALDTAAQQRSAPAQREAWQMPAGAVESGKLIGARIKNADNKDIGEIDALIVNSADGKITHVVVGKGGIAGIGETKVVVPWSDVTLRAERDTVVVSMDQAALDRAPRYERRQAGERDRTTQPAASPRTNERKK
jgi:sporulation protein YlmC with PRC-barrel domain